MINDSLTGAFYHYHMGITADNIAGKYSITQQALDQLQVESQKKDALAIKKECFKDEIVLINSQIEKIT